MEWLKNLFESKHQKRPGVGSVKKKISEHICQPKTGFLIITRPLLLEWERGKYKNVELSNIRSIWNKRNFFGKVKSIFHHFLKGFVYLPPWTIINNNVHVSPSRTFGFQTKQTWVKKGKWILECLLAFKQN